MSNQYAGGELQKTIRHRLPARKVMDTLMPEEEDRNGIVPRSLTRDALKPKPMEEDGSSEDRPFAPFTMPEFPIFPGAGRVPAPDSRKPVSQPRSVEEVPRLSTHHMLQVEVDSSLVRLKEAGHPAPMPNDVISNAAPQARVATPPEPSIREPQNVASEPILSQAQSAATVPPHKKSSESRLSSNQSVTVMEAVQKNLLWIILSMIPVFLILVLQTVPRFLFYTPEHQAFYYFSKFLSSGLFQVISVGVLFLCLMIALSLPIISLKKSKVEAPQKYRHRRRKRRL